MRQRQGIPKSGAFKGDAVLLFEGMTEWKMEIISSSGWIIVNIRRKSKKVMRGNRQIMFTFVVFEDENTYLECVQFI